MAEETSFLEQAFAETGAQLDRIIDAYERKKQSSPITYVYFSNGSIKEYNVVGSFEHDSFPDIDRNDKSSIVKIELGNTITSIGVDAFEYYSALTSLIIPNSITSINAVDDFSNCPNELFDITTIPNVKLIDGWAVGYTSSLAGNLNLTGIRGIVGGGAFTDCVGITSLTIPNSIIDIPDFTFSDCAGLTSVTIPNSVTSIRNSAFYGCSGLTSITIPDSVTSISNSAFAGCAGLTSVTIPNSVISIEDYAFYNTSIMDTYMTTKSSVEVQAMDYYPWGLPAGGVIHFSDGDWTIPDSGSSGS